MSSGAATRLLFDLAQQINRGETVQDVTVLGQFKTILNSVGVGKKQQDVPDFIVGALKLVDCDEYVESMLAVLGVSKEVFAEMESMTADDAHDLLGIQYQPMAVLDNADERIGGGYLAHRSIVSNNMYITFKKTVKCNVCGACSDSDEHGITRGTPFLELLPPSGSSSLATLIRTEMSAATDDYKCNSCGGLSVEASIESHFRKLPPHLLIHLNRMGDEESQVGFPAKNSRCRTPISLRRSTTCARSWCSWGRTEGAIT